DDAEGGAGERGRAGGAVDGGRFLVRGDGALAVEGDTDGHGIVDGDEPGHVVGGDRQEERGQSVDGDAARHFGGREEESVADRQGTAEDLAGRGELAGGAEAGGEVEGDVGAVPAEQVGRHPVAAAGVGDAGVEVDGAGG